MKETDRQTSRNVVFFIWLHNQCFPFRFQLFCMKKIYTANRPLSLSLIHSHTLSHLYVEHIFFCSIRFYFYVNFFFYLKTLIKNNHHSILVAVVLPRFESIYEICIPQWFIVHHFLFSFPLFPCITDMFELLPPEYCFASHHIYVMRVFYRRLGCNCTDENGNVRLHSARHLELGQIHTSIQTIMQIFGLHIFCAHRYCSGILTHTHTHTL